MQKYILLNCLKVLAKIYNLASNVDVNRFLCKITKRIEFMSQVEKLDNCFQIYTVLTHRNILSF